MNMSRRFSYARTAFLRILPPNVAVRHLGTLGCSARWCWRSDTDSGSRFRVKLVDDSSCGGLRSVDSDDIPQNSINNE